MLSIDIWKRVSTLSYFLSVEKRFPIFKGHALFSPEKCSFKSRQDDGVPVFTGLQWIWNLFNDVCLGDTLVLKFEQINVRFYLLIEHNP